MANLYKQFLDLMPDRSLQVGEFRLDHISQ